MPLLTNTSKLQVKNTFQSPISVAKPSLLCRAHPQLGAAYHIKKCREPINRSTALNTSTVFKLTYNFRESGWCWAENKPSYTHPIFLEMAVHRGWWHRPRSRRQIVERGNKTSVPHDRHACKYEPDMLAEAVSDIADIVTTGGVLWLLD